MKTKTRLHHQHKNWERNQRDYDSKIIKKMERGTIVDRVSEARSNVQAEKKVVTPGKIISELSFGFRTSLFDTKFEMTLWKSLRLSFPNCPKEIRKRRSMSAKFNGWKRPGKCSSKLINFGI